VLELSSLFCNHICSLSTTETICEVRVELLLVCACVNSAVHNMLNVFTVLYVSYPCAQFCKTSVCAICVLLSLPNTWKLMYFSLQGLVEYHVSACAVFFSTQHAHWLTSCSSFICVFILVVFIFNGPNSQDCLLVRKSTAVYSRDKEYL
jgi:hypothetical protein